MLLKQKRKKSGFTLIELLLSMTLLATAFALSVPLFQSFLFRSEIEDALNLSYKSLRIAQVYAESGNQDTQWGVKFQSSQVVVFSGTSYATRNTNFDKTYDLSSRITASGVTEIVFSKIDGFPNTTGTITLNGNNVTKQLVINAKGQINF